MERTITNNYQNIRIGAYAYNVNVAHPNILKDFHDLLPHYQPDKPVYLKIDDTMVHLPVNVTNKVLITNWQEMTDNDCNQIFVDKKKVLVDYLLKQTYAKGYETPSCVQSLGIIPLCMGKDTLIQSKSGTGKTHAFLMGTAWHFDAEDKELQHLYITSSHEVANQIYRVAQQLFPTNAQISLCIGQKKDTTIHTKYPTLKEERETVATAQIVIGTMGKIYDYLCNKKWLNTQYLKTLCVDEFDNIVTSRGNRSHQIITTENQMAEIIKIIPNKCQKIFFSATVNDHALQIANSYFQSDKEPFIALLQTDDFTLEGIKQHYVECINYNEKKEVLLDLLKQCHISQCIVFCNTIETVTRLKQFLDDQKNHIATSLFHAGLSATARMQAMTEFRQYKTRLLISTDLTARGIDIPGINLVINYDMPHNLNTYIHRVGRSGRYGKKGIAISLISKDNGEITKVNQVNECSINNPMTPLPKDLENLL